MMWTGRKGSAQARGGSFGRNYRHARHAMMLAISPATGLRYISHRVQSCGIEHTPADREQHESGKQSPHKCEQMVPRYVLRRHKAYCAGPVLRS
jgi:hypothetical protein